MLTLPTHSEPRFKTMTKEEPEVFEANEEIQEESFASMSRAQKRFHILFYITAGTAGLVLVQLIWQIAVLTAAN